MVMRMRFLLAVVGLFLMIASVITTISVVFADESDIQTEPTAETSEDTSGENPTPEVVEVQEQSDAVVQPEQVASVVEVVPTIEVAPLVPTEQPAEVIQPEVVEPPVETVATEIVSEVIQELPVVEVTSEIQPSIEVTAEATVPVEPLIAEVTSEVQPVETTVEKTPSTGSDALQSDVTTGIEIDALAALPVTALPTDNPPTNIVTEIASPVGNTDPAQESLNHEIVPMPQATEIAPPTSPEVPLTSATQEAMPVLEATAEVTPASIALSQISGEIIFPGFESRPLTNLTLTLPDNNVVRSIADADGRFAFADLQPGNYRLEASAAGFLSSRIEFTLAEGQIMLLPTAALTSGDVNQDNVINIKDAVLVAANFDGPAKVAEADITGDGWVDIRDLSLIGAQYGNNGPASWN